MRKRAGANPTTGKWRGKLGIAEGKKMKEHPKARTPKSGWRRKKQSRNSDGPKMSQFSLQCY